MTGLYVYAVVRPEPDVTGRGVTGTGVGGAALDVVAAEGLHAVVHEHVAGPYVGSDDDVRRWVVEHSQVVDRLWQTSPTLPMSFNVIVAAGEQAAARDRLTAWLTENAVRLNARLDELTGRVELRVEVGLDQHEALAGSPDIDALRAELVDRPAGVRRLLSKQLEHREREMTASLADELYPALRRRLFAAAEEAVENRRAHPEPAVVPVLNVALLVPREGIDRIGQELARFQAEYPAARIRYLGPWPPYSFADATAEPGDGDRPSTTGTGE